jgi:hypothetical protein
MNVKMLLREICQFLEPARDRDREKDKDRYTHQ